jgi:hypothetical protein
MVATAAAATIAAVATADVQVVVPALLSMLLPFRKLLRPLPLATAVCSALPASVVRL